MKIPLFAKRLSLCRRSFFEAYAQILWISAGAAPPRFLLLGDAVGGFTHGIT